MPGSIVTLLTPLFQKVGGVIRKVYYETIASQVKFSDGTDLQTKFTALSNAVSGQTVTYVVNDIAARNALDVSTLHVGDQAYVKDATADNTVRLGAAKYIVESISGDPATATWVKTAEAESMDLIINWADVQNKPTETTSDIDAAVGATKTLTGHTLSVHNTTGLQLDGVDVGRKYGATVAVSPDDEGFDAAVAALNLPDGAFFTVVPASNGD